MWVYALAAVAAAVTSALRAKKIKTNPNYFLVVLIRTILL